MLRTHSWVTLLCALLSNPSEVTAQNLVGKSFFGNRLDLELRSQNCQSKAADQFKRSRSLGIQRKLEQKPDSSLPLSSHELAEITRQAEESADSSADGCFQPSSPQPTIIP